MWTMLKKMAGDERGQVTTEYGLLLGVVAIVTITLLAAVRTNLRSLYTSANTALVSSIE